MSFKSLTKLPCILTQLDELGFKKPTPIQEQVIPVANKGADIIAAAQTGSGKTAAFAIPLIERFEDCSELSANTCKALILVPTRELAVQVYDSVVQLSKGAQARSQLVYGGVKINPQMMKLRKGTHILVATPGRLIDLVDKNTVSLKHLEVLVLDEADKLLELGFQQEVDRIISQLPNKRQTLLFSATYSARVKALASRVLSNPKSINVGKQNTTAITVEQWLYPVDKKQKSNALIETLQSNSWRQVLVFVKTKKGANKVCFDLNKNGIKAETIHGDKSQQQRQRSLEAFKHGECRVLVATDVASRGLDIHQLPAVINLDLPKVAHDYVHRIGRTGRAGEKGVAISLVCADEIDLLRSIESTIGKLINRKWLDGFEPEHNLPASTLKPGKKKKPHKKKLAKAKLKAEGMSNSKSNNKKTSKSTGRANRRAPGFLNS